MPPVIKKSEEIEESEDEIIEEPATPPKKKSVPSEPAKIMGEGKTKKPRETEPQESLADIQPLVDEVARLSAKVSQLLPDEIIEVPDDKKKNKESGKENFFEEIMNDIL